MGCIDEHGSTPRGVGEIDFRKASFFKRFAAKFFSKITSRFSKGGKGRGNLIVNAFFLENFHHGTLWFPGVMKG